MGWMFGWTDRACVVVNGDTDELRAQYAGPIPAGRADLGGSTAMSCCTGVNLTNYEYLSMLVKCTDVLPM